MAQDMAVIGFVGPSQVGQLYRVTTTSVERWNGSAWVTVAANVFTGGVHDYFSFTGWGSELLMTNGVDKIFFVNSETGANGFITQSFPAKHIQSFGNRVVATNVKEPGGQKPFRVRWCVKNNNRDWTGDGSGFEDLFAAPGGRVDIAHGCYPITDDTAYIVRSETFWHMSLTGLVLAPFRFTRLMSAEAGMMARRSVVSTPDGLIGVAEENVMMLTSAGLKPIGDEIREILIPSISDIDAAVGFYDKRRNEYRLAVGNTVWRRNFRTPGWTKDVYPHDIRYIARVKLEQAGLVINDLTGFIDGLSTAYPPGFIDSLTQSLGGIDAIFFILFDSSASIIVHEDPSSTQDVNIDEDLVDPEIIATTALLQAGSVLDKTKPIELQVEYEAEVMQDLIFEYSIDAGTTWSTFSTKTVNSTTGPAVLAVRKTITGHNIQLRLRSTVLGKLRVLAFVPHVIVEAKVNV